MEATVAKKELADFLNANSDWTTQIKVMKEREQQLLESNATLQKNLDKCNQVNFLNFFRNFNKF
jgi:hypothetical protein